MSSSTDQEGRLAFLIAVLLCLLNFVFLLCWPITPLGTDLWYHLNGGRYIIEHGAIPQDSFFSFISPSRSWVDYYWLFQVLVYAVHAAWSYTGLIVLSAVVYVMTVTVILRFLLADQGDCASRPWFAFLSVLCAMTLLVRDTDFRPHAFTYLCAVTFLYALEYRPRWMAALPLVGWLWSNLHGIMYPVMLVLVGAYAIEDLLTVTLKRTGGQRAGRALLLLAATGASVCLTPHGVRLLRLPFVPIAAASQYIVELRPQELPDLFSYHIAFLSPEITTAFNVLFLLACVAAIVALVNRGARISHLLLFAAGLVLMSRGVRFGIEFMLLSLPLLKANPLILSTHLTARAPRGVYVLGICLLTLMPIRMLIDASLTRPAYPFSDVRLPAGVTTFLKRVGVGGRVLNSPNSGGYLQWELYPRYRIFMDMQIPFLFTDEDMYLLKSLGQDEQALRGVLSRYHPDFISVPRDLDRLAERVRSVSGYALVFFDNAEALFVDRRQHPQLAAQWEVTTVDPFKPIEELKEATLKKSKADQALCLQELQRLVEMYPDLGIANYLMAMLYNEAGAYEQAVPHGETIIRVAPDWPIGYEMTGDAWRGLRRFPQAIEAYRKAIARSNSKERRDLYKRIGKTYLEIGEDDKAFATLKMSVNVFSSPTMRDDLHSLALAALRTGKLADAQTAYGYLYLQASAAGDTQWMETLTREVAGSAIRLQPSGQR